MNPCLFISAFRYELKNIIFCLLSWNSNERSFFMEKMSKTKKMILSALMLTLSIVLSRFISIKTPLLAISFSFVPIMLSAIWLGPKYTVVISRAFRSNWSNFIPFWRIFCRIYN